MLIPFSNIISKYKISKKILHIGAHTCEERNDYIAGGFSDDKVIWIEGNQDIVNQVKSSIPSINIYESLISDKDDTEVEFIITNNGQSSSILELDEHLKEHPYVFEIKRCLKKTITVDTFIKNNNINIYDIEFVNIDIQGAELLALKGMKETLYYVNYLYLEVNLKHLYKNCALVSEIDDFLKEYNFTRIDSVFTKHGWGDALYVKLHPSNTIFNNCDPNTNGEKNFI